MKLITRISILSMVVVTGLMILLPGCQLQSGQVDILKQVDSLNRLAYELRYKNLGASTHAANRAYELSHDYADGRAEAINNMAFSAFMRMDFEQSMRLYKKAEAAGRNEIEALVANVGMMKIAQRTSMNKEFYDYRNKALKRMKLIEEDRSSITNPAMLKRLNYATSEFYIVSGIYYYYLQQYKRSIDAIYTLDENTLESDSSQWLYYLYMKGSGDMYIASTQEDITIGEFRYLIRCYQNARTGGYTYFEANALQGMAEILLSPTNRTLIAEHQPGLLRLLNGKNLPIDELPIDLAQRALSLFKRYGDMYQISGVYRTIASYYNKQHQPLKALECLEAALGYVNIHHNKYYHPKDSLDRLMPYSPYNRESLELKWIKQDGIKTVPEWIARLREQLSLTYSAIGRKTESDYNRNIYLDLLDYTRQDKELESRFMELEAESSDINVLLTMVVVLALVLIIAIIIFNKRWKKHHQTYLTKLRNVLDLCRKVSSALPATVSDIDEVLECLEESIQEDLKQIFQIEKVRILLPNADLDEGKLQEGKTYTLPLLSSRNNEEIGLLEVVAKSKLKKEDWVILHQLLPYLSWSIENGFVFVSLDEKMKMMETEQYVRTQHLIENKKQNEIKKACMAIVMGIFPYLDRIVNEVDKLIHQAYTKDDEVKRNKFAYINELINKINEYNDILAIWIKMRRGEVGLHIDNFCLDDLFQIIAKGKRSIEMKNQTLTVSPAKFDVKADKALTLFMVNTLVENAHKYTQEGGIIEVNAIDSGSYVEISVQDNGPGLSDEDISKILGEKVYDSGQIGMQSSINQKELQRRKGYGFGLMNCKGIIEKYKKTNAVFNVCSFGIDSELGKGSRFYFRLPKGIRRTLTIFIGLIFLCIGSSCHEQQPIMKEHTASHEVAYDSLLAIANGYANRVYNANILGEYKTALYYADSVYYYLNEHYLLYSGKKTPLLKKTGKGTAADLTWWSNDFDTDYYILLDVRNETAVAALALKDFDTYNYNNAAYTALYRQISKDNTLEQYCLKMEQSASNKRIGLALILLLVVVAIVAYYFLFMRYRLRYQYNLEQVFKINQAVYTASLHEQDEELIQHELVQRLFDEFNELLPMNNLSLTLYHEGNSHNNTLFYAETDATIVEKIEEWMERKPTQSMELQGWNLLPLWVDDREERFFIGGLGIHSMQSNKREEYYLLVELVAQFLGIVLYQSVISVQKMQHNLEMAQDEASRISFEENMIHVQNMVLDNCLSTIKHETIYYPNKIKQIVDKLNEANRPADENEQLQSIEELVRYYKEIFTILSMCASRQLEEVTFKRTDIKVSSLVKFVENYLKKVLKKKTFALQLELDVESDFTLSGDEVLMKMMFECLINEAVSFEQEGRIGLKVRTMDDFVRFDFMDNRRTFSVEDLNQLFYPHLHRMSHDGGLKGTEYLICKQIIRDHDEFAGKRGCRINAIPQENKDAGFTVWFTIPMKKK